MLSEKEASNGIESSMINDDEDYKIVCERILEMKASLVLLGSLNGYGTRNWIDERGAILMQEEIKKFSHEISEYEKRQTRASNELH